MPFSVSSRRQFLLSTALASLACRRKAAGFSGHAFVANQEGKAVAVVDLTAFAATRHIALPASPTQVATHASRPFVYALTPESRSVHQIHADSLRLGTAVKLAGQAEAVRFSKDGSALWALCPEARQLARIDVEPWRSKGAIALPASPLDFDIAESESASDGLAIVSLGDAGELALVDLRQGRLRQRIRLGGHLGKVRFRKDGQQLLVANLEDRQLLIYDLAAGRVTVRLPLAVRPDRFCMLDDGGQMFITGEGMDGLVTVYPYQTEVRGTVLAGRAPGFVAASVDPPYLFVANQQSGDVTIINVTTQKVMAVARVGKDPSFIAITPNDEYALVLNRGSGDMAVLHIGTLTATRTKAAPLFTMVPVGSGPVSAVVRSV